MPLGVVLVKLAAFRVAQKLSFKQLPSFDGGDMLLALPQLALFKVSQADLHTISKVSKIRLHQ